MTQLPSDVEIAKDYVDLYYKQAGDLEEKLKELAIDKKSFQLLFGEFVTLHRLAITSEQSWKNALQAEFDRARQAKAKKPFWQKAR